MREKTDLFVVSVLVLFLELAFIRWFPAHVLFLSFFTNTVLLACFLGMSVGCLAAGHRRNYLMWTPVFLAVALGAAQLIEWERQRTGSTVAVGNLASPQLVFFGVETQPYDPSRFIVPIEAVSGVVFCLIVLAMLGPGQQLGRSLARVPNRLVAYTVNIAGSLAGVLLFTACSRWQLGPVWWFGLCAMCLVVLVRAVLPFKTLLWGAAVFASLLLASDSALSGRSASGNEQRWSPYYRIDYDPTSRFINVNLIGHQVMISRETPAPAYAFPHVLNRDTGRPLFGQVLIIGAGSGNDVSRALEWGAARIDAVEIDPAIYDLGVRDHPDRPYADHRVVVHLDDGRNYLRSTQKQYDLIVYALVDSLVLHSSYSNIRLESYLFTQEAFADIRKRLKPDGLFVMYNYFRQGWIIARLQAMLETAFGAGNPVVFNLPARASVQPDDVLYGDFTVFFSGSTSAIKEAFARQQQYRLRPDRPVDRQTPDGFSAGPWPKDVQVFHPTAVMLPTPALRPATDTWPFLYLREPMIPSLSLRGMAIMGGIAAVFLLPFLRRRARATGSLPPQAPRGLLPSMFLLGAGFMLIETKAVVQMALLFGSTWIVNSVVFAAVLIMILAANVLVLVFRPRSVAPFYAGLILSLAAGAFVPLDALLGLSRGQQVALSCLIAFTPILFAGVVFAASFARTADADRALGVNIAGAMAGGLTEYASMLMGFQYLALVAALFYGLSWASIGRRLHT